MPLTQVAIDRLLQVKRHILEEPRRFDMNYVRNPDSAAPCGTPCCVAGWLIKLEYPEIGPSLSDEEFWCSPHGTGDISEAAELLDISLSAAQRLFYHRNWRESLRDAYLNARTDTERAQAGANAIDAFIAEAQ